MLDVRPEIYQMLEREMALPMKKSYFDELRIRTDDRYWILDARPERYQMPEREMRNGITYEKIALR